MGVRVGHARGLEGGRALLERIACDRGRAARDFVLIQVLAEAAGSKPRIILIASGSEVGLAVDARAKLEADGIPTRVVSMPCWEFFEKQPADYREMVLPGAVRARLAIEAGATLGWWRWVGDGGGVVGLDRFGASAPGETVMRELGFSVENVVARATALL